MVRQTNIVLDWATFSFQIIFDEIDELFIQLNQNVAKKETAFVLWFSNGIQPYLANWLIAELGWF